MHVSGRRGGRPKLLLLVENDGSHLDVHLSRWLTTAEAKWKNIENSNFKEKIYGFYELRDQFIMVDNFFINYKANWKIKPTSSFTRRRSRFAPF